MILPSNKHENEHSSITGRPNMELEKPLVSAKINNQTITVPEGTAIYEAAKTLGFNIPILCHYNISAFKLKHTVGSCRICVVEIKNWPNLMPACATPVQNGMEIFTHNPRVLKARRTVLQLLISNHPFECLTCNKAGQCDLQRLAEEFDIHTVKYSGKKSKHKKDYAQEAILRDPDKCIMCRRCETACNIVQTVGVLTGKDRGFDSVVGTFNNRPLAETQCTFCGQCVSVCPTGALTSISCNQEVIEALHNPKKTVVFQIAPAVRVSLGEMFKMPAGSIVTGKIVTALKQIGADYVFDTNWAADLTIMEEAHEIVERIKEGKNLPILTSCCPGWVNFFEYSFPDLLDIPSSAKSPQQMFGSVIKRLWCQTKGLDPKNVICVSIMPCVAKKYEAARPEHSSGTVRDVDLVMTTQEFSMLLKESGIELSTLPDSEFDPTLGESSGAGAIFANSGGVLEAALRTASKLITGKDLPDDKIEFQEVRGHSGIREATLDIGGATICVAQASGLGNARILLNDIRANRNKYHVIEVMACPGGCVDGGGQPYLKGNSDILLKRIQAIYEIDRGKKIRRSHDNPEIKALYKDHLQEAGSPLAHKILHTKYFSKKDIKK